MKIIELLMYLYLLLKPYYLFESGGIQISDCFLILAFLMFILFTKEKKNYTKEIFNENKMFLLFVILTMIVNVFYFLFYLKFKFILSSLYFIFNYLTIIIFAFLFKHNNNFSIKVSKIFKFNLIVQLILTLFSIGRTYGTIRWMSTFNDPNQFAFYAFLSYSYIYAMSYRNHDSKYIFIYFLISLYLIVESCSTGMLLGMITYLAMLLFNFVKKFPVYFAKYKNKIALISIVVFTFFISSSLLGNSSRFNFSKYIYNSDIYGRVINKISRVDKNEMNDSSTMTIWQERGYDKIALYPHYLIYGSGEGEYNRFSKSAHTSHGLGEIHATLPSIWFYYGLIPFIIILLWIAGKFSKTNKDLILIVYVPLIFESFFLLNSRQALFWILIAIGPYLKKDDNYEVKESK